MSSGKYKIEQRRLMIERNCLETTERDLKAPWSPLKNLKIYSQMSSGKYASSSVVIAIIVTATKFLSNSY
jgi:hypothetical protein